MKIRFIVMLVTLLSIALPAYSMDLSIDDAIKLGLDGEDMKMALYNIDKIDAMIEEAYANNYPTLNISANYKASTSVFVDMNALTKPSNFNALVEASYLLFAFGAIQNSLDSIRLNRASMEIQKEITSAELTYSIKLAYYACLVSDDILAIAEASYNNAVRSKRMLESQATVRVSQSDLTKVSADIASRKTDVEVAKVNKAISYRLLKSLANIYTDEGIRLTTKFVLKSIPTLDRKSLLSNIEQGKKNEKTGDSNESILHLQIYDKQIEADRLLAKSKSKGWWPKLSLIGGYTYTNSSNFGSSPASSIPGFDFSSLLSNNTDNAYIGFALTFPIFDGFKSRGQAKQTTIDSYIKASQKSIKRRDIRKEVEDAIEDYSSYQRIIKVNDEAIVLGQRAYDLSLARFLNGQTSATELNDVERSLSALKQSKVNSVNKIFSSLAVIEKYLGRLD